MASSSNGHQQHQGDGNLPLIRCPRCGRARVSTGVTRKEGPNKGRRFYKCPLEDAKNPCKWFGWEEEYAFFVSAAQENGVQPPPATAHTIQAALTNTTTSWIAPMLIMNTVVNVIICLAIISGSQH